MPHSLLYLLVTAAAAAAATIVVGFPPRPQHQRHVVVVVVVTASTGLICIRRRGRPPRVRPREALPRYKSETHVYDDPVDFFSRLFEFFSLELLWLSFAIGRRKHVFRVVRAQGREISGYTSLSYARVSSRDSEKFGP